MNKVVCQKKVVKKCESCWFWEKDKAVDGMAKCQWVKFNHLPCSMKECSVDKMMKATDGKKCKCFEEIV